MCSFSHLKVFDLIRKKIVLDFFLEYLFGQKWYSTDFEYLLMTDSLTKIVFVLEMLMNNSTFDDNDLFLYFIVNLFSI